MAGLDDTAALHETREQVENDIVDKLVYVAYIDDVVVGSLRVECINEETAYLSRFGVSADYQNLGIGKSMMGVFDMEMKNAQQEEEIANQEEQIEEGQAEVDALSQQEEVPQPETPQEPPAEQPVEEVSDEQIAQLEQMAQAVDNGEV